MEASKQLLFLVFFVIFGSCYARTDSTIVIVQKGWKRGRVKEVIPDSLSLIVGADTFTFKGNKFLLPSSLPKDSILKSQKPSLILYIGNYSYPNINCKSLEFLNSYYKIIVEIRNFRNSYFAWSSCYWNNCQYSSGKRCKISS